MSETQASAASVFMRRSNSWRTCRPRSVNPVSPERLSGRILVGARLPPVAAPCLAPGASPSVHTGRASMSEPSSHRSGLWSTQNPNSNSLPGSMVAPAASRLRPSSLRQRICSASSNRSASGWRLLGISKRTAGILSDTCAPQPSSNPTPLQDYRGGPPLLPRSCARRMFQSAGFNSPLTLPAYYTVGMRLRPFT